MNPVLEVLRNDVLQFGALLEDNGGTATILLPSGLERYMSARLSESVEEIIDEHERVVFVFRRPKHDIGFRLVAIDPSGSGPH